MSDRSSWAMGVLVWVLVVLAGSSLVWVVISHAGEGVAPQPGASVAAGDPATDTGRPTSLPSTRPPKGSATGQATPRSGAPTSPPPSGPSPSAAPTGGSETGPGEPSPQETPSAPAGTPPSRRTWSGAGGNVVAECTGSRIRLVAAQPDGGFAVEVGNRGPGQVEVSFHGRGDEERESEIHTLCVGGTPRFSAESKRED